MTNFKADSKHGLDLTDLRSHLPSEMSDAEGKATWIQDAPPRYFLVVSIVQQRLSRCDATTTSYVEPAASTKLCAMTTGYLNRLPMAQSVFCSAGPKIRCELAVDMLIIITLYKPICLVLLG